METTTRTALTLGQVVVTTACWHRLHDDLDADSARVLGLLRHLLERHRAGDWGDLDPEDWAANDLARVGGGRLLSAYQLGPTRVWCITEADRSVTTVLLPSDY